MSKYSCEICSFFTDNKTDYSRHNRTKKHKEKVNSQLSQTIAQPKPNQTSAKNGKTEINKTNKKEYTCPFCNSIFTRLCNLSRHKSICGKTDIENIKTEHIIEKMELLEKRNKELEKQVNTYESLLKSTMAPQTITNFNFISNTYQDTPALEGQTSYINMCEAKTMSLVELIYLYYHDNKLVIFIGDYIIKLYKKEEPKDQAMWSSDVSRLTYIIRESYNKKSNVWTYDKKGAQTKKIIIEPALNYLRETLFDYCKKNSGSIKESVLKHMITANEVIQLIDSGKLADDIVRYIAPEFYIKQIEGPEIKQIEGPTKTKITEEPKTKVIKVTEEPKTKVTKVLSELTNEVVRPIIKKNKDKELLQDSDLEEQDFIRTLREIKAEHKLKLEQDYQTIESKLNNHNLYVD